MNLLLLLLSGCLNIFLPTDRPIPDPIDPNPVRLTAAEQLTLQKQLQQVHKRYDTTARLLTVQIDGYQYHRDTRSGTYHDLRTSANYALALLNSGDGQYRQRAFAILETCLSLQDTGSHSPTRGIWSYYLEEPLQTKKSPPDYNTADFMAVILLDIWTGHGKDLPTGLAVSVRSGLIRAALSIQKRNVGPAYTNIAIMGTYVTYLVAHLFDLPDMKAYASTRLSRFYDYTLRKGGFTEFNSPTYTLVALDELNRMQRHIREPVASQQIDSLYALGWAAVAHHFHKPTGQWAGPHSRAYNSLVSPAFYTLLSDASNGLIYPQARQLVNWSTYKRLHHQIPSYLLPYFTTNNLPRTETVVFEPDAPPQTGTTYLSDRFVLGTCNRSSMWNQRRPFLAHWGTQVNPRYLQIRFLHDNYDFSAATFHSQQRENRVLAAINITTDSGDKHIHIDRINAGRLTASDLRLRFEFGQYPFVDSLRLPSSPNAPVTLQLDGLLFSICLFKTAFGQFNGTWQTGGNGTASWLDFVVYTGPEITIDLTSMQAAILAFTFAIDPLTSSNSGSLRPRTTENGTLLTADWNGMKLQTPMRPLPFPKHTSR